MVGKVEKEEREAMWWFASLVRWLLLCWWKTLTKQRLGLLCFEAVKSNQSQAQRCSLLSLRPTKVAGQLILQRCLKKSSQRPTRS
jgi:hypothetical protein